MTGDASSPLQGWQLRRSSVALAEIPFLTQLDVRTREPGTLSVELPIRPCTWTRTGGCDALWLGPDEWLVLAGPGTRSPESELRRTMVRGAVTDVSAQRTTIRLGGSGARALLAKGCAIDLHQSVSPPGTCVQTLLAQTGVVLVVRPDDFLLLVRSSFAEYLAAWLTDASTEL